MSKRVPGLVTSVLVAFSLVAGTMPNCAPQRPASGATSASSSGGHPDHGGAQHSDYGKKNSPCSSHDTDCCQAMGPCAAAALAVEEMRSGGAPTLSSLIVSLDVFGPAAVPSSVDPPPPKA